MGMFEIMHRLIVSQNVIRNLKESYMYLADPHNPIDTHPFVESSSSWTTPAK